MALAQRDARQRSESIVRPYKPTHRCAIRNSNLASGWLGVTLGVQRWPQGPPPCLGTPAIYSFLAYRVKRLRIRSVHSATLAQSGGHHQRLLRLPIMLLVLRYCVIYYTVSCFLEESARCHLWQSSVECSVTQNSGARPSLASESRVGRGGMHCIITASAFDNLSQM